MDEAKRLMGSPMRTETADHTMFFYFAPSKSLTINFDADGVSKDGKLGDLIIKPSS
jgi:hypothetical protein